MKNELLENGYRQFNPDVMHPNAVGAYQKAIRGEAGRLYFINVYEYEPFPGSNLTHNTFMAEAQFENENSHFDVTLHRFASVDELESFYQKIWELGCIPYDK